MKTTENKKRRPYVKPSMAVIPADPQSLLAGSPGLKAVDGANSSDGFPTWGGDSDDTWTDVDATM